jgi:hypothetical protein
VSALLEYGPVTTTDSSSSSSLPILKQQQVPEASERMAHVVTPYYSGEAVEKANPST